MKAGKLLLAIAILAMGAGVCQAQTNRTRDVQRAAVRAMRNREQARKDSIEKAKAQAVIDSLNEVEAKREKQMEDDEATVRRASIRRGIKAIRNRAKAGAAETTEAAETVDVDVSGKSGETQEYKVSKSSTQPTQRTADDIKNEKEGAYGRATRPQTGTSNSNQQNTGQRPPTGTSQTKENTGSRPSSSSNTGSRPSSGSGSRSGAPETSSGTGSRPSSSSNTGSRSGNDNTAKPTVSSSAYLGKEAVATADPADHDKALRSYLESNEYRTKETQKALVYAKSEALQGLPDVIVNSEGAFMLVNEKIDNTDKAGDGTFFGPDESVIFPGNLVYVNQQLADGNPVPCAFSPGKVRLTIDKNVPGGLSYADVINDYAHVHQQIVDWCSRINDTDESYTAEGRTFYYSDASHMAVDLGVSVSFLKNRAKVDMSTKTDELKIISVENLCQYFYTVYASAIDNDPTTLIGSKTAVSTIKSNVNKNGPIGLITSVSYGRRAYRFREFHSKDFTFNGSESVSGGVGAVKGSLSSTQEVTNSQRTSKMWAFVQSGNQTDKEIFYNNDANEGNSDFMKIVNKNSKYSAYNIGIPRNFTVRFLGNQGEAKRVVTDVYYETKYIPCPKTVKLEINKTASQVGGSTIRYTVNYKVVHVTKWTDSKGNPYYKAEVWDSPKTKGAADAEKGYVDYTAKKFSQGEERENRTIPTDDCFDKDNCYVYGELFWILDGNHSSGQSYQEWDRGYIPIRMIPDDSSGRGKKATIYIGGSNYAKNKPYIRSDSTGGSNANK